MPTIKLSLYQLLLSTAVFSFFYFSGCSDTITNSSQTEKFLSHSEQEFADNPNLRANDSGVVVLNLEALNAPADNIPDTYTRGIDIIPYNFSQDNILTFRIGDSSYFTAKLANASGDTLFRLLNPKDSVRINLQAGNYKLIVQSSYDYSVSPVENKTVFIQPIKKSNKEILLQTNSCTSCDLKGIELLFANLRGARISLSDHSFSIISFSNLSNAKMDFTKMNATTLSNSNLDSADMSNSQMSFSNLGGSSLYNASLFRCNLSNAGLVSSTLNYTNLNNASLIFAEMRGAQITNSNLNGADISNANLCGTVFTNNQVSGIRFNSFTKCYP